MLRHSGAPRGKQVVVVLKDGTRITDKFYERNDRYIFLARYGKVAKKDIQTFTIRRGRHPYQRRPKRIDVEDM